MDSIILFDDPAIRGSLLPFTFTRPIAEIRVGTLKISDKWAQRSKLPVSFLTQNYLQGKFPRRAGDAIAVNGSWIPDENSAGLIQELKPHQALFYGKTLVAAFIGETEKNLDFVKDREIIQLEKSPKLLLKTWNIFQYNGEEIRKDFEILTKGRNSQKLNDPYTKVYAPENLFIEEGAVIRAAVLNAENGPIYIGRNAEIQEGALIRGPFSLGDHSTVNMGAKIKGDTTIGPHSKVGGEISNSVLFGYSNKAHDGFLGNSVIGEWCNMGADTNTSNLKNNYSEVKLWDYISGTYADTGLQFCGLMLGDHSKCGINTMFNTGTVIGVGANVYGDGFPRNFIPSFAWGGAAGYTTFKFSKFIETARAVYSRRGLEFSEGDEEVLKFVYDLSKNYRIWEKSS